MTNWTRMYAVKAEVEKVEDVTIPPRIDALLNNGLVNDWEKNFLSSIKEGYNKYKALTAGQNNTFLNIEKRYTAEAVAAKNNWINNWDTEKSETFKKVVDYYHLTPYYPKIMLKVKNDKNYIPTEEEYKAICENPYSKKYLKQLDTPAKFHVGQLIIYKRYSIYKLATIISVGEVTGHTKGSRYYTILPIGKVKTIEVVEKQLLYYRECMNKKITTAEDTPF